MSRRLPICGARHPEAPNIKCILAPMHKGRFHRSFTRIWEVKEENK
jgi:hypothetical protein